jgi:hypothetical protein
MDLAVELVDLHCLVEAAGLAVPLRLAKKVALAGFQRFVEEAGLAVPLQLAEEVALVGFQHFVEEAGSAGPAMVVGLLLVEQNWIPQPPHNIPEGILD